ncbi:MAG: glycosyltransferase [Verrucomicrobiota bacterium]
MDIFIHVPSDRLRLLYLSYAFPPGVSGRFPSLNAAGHAAETCMIQAFARKANISSIGMMAREVFGKLEPRDDSLGLEHDLLLWDRRPELWHRWSSLMKLRHFYQSKTVSEGMPDIVLVKNLGPVYNFFVRWLRRQSPRPMIVLLLADASRLGQRLSLSKRFRSTFKPMVTLDEEKAIRWFDACVSFSPVTRSYFEPRGVPWMWMPSAFNFRYDPPLVAANQSGPIRFGYFGTLGGHSNVIPMVQAFLQSKVSGSLHVCGHGGAGEILKKLSAQHLNFHFDGLLPRQSDCLAWSQKVDVLINPRLPILGLENSFPSKIFEYAMTGKAILSTRTGGVDEVLGEEAFYLGTDKFEEVLCQRIREVSTTQRGELARRGLALRHRVLNNYNWDEQARRMLEFFEGIIKLRGRQSIC